MSSYAFGPVCLDQLEFTEIAKLCLALAETSVWRWGNSDVQMLPKISTYEQYGGFLSVFNNTGLCHFTDRHKLSMELACEQRVIPATSFSAGFRTLTEDLLYREKWL